MFNIKTALVEVFTSIAIGFMDFAPSIGILSGVVLVNLLLYLRDYFRAQRARVKKYHEQFENPTNEGRDEMD